MAGVPAVVEGLDAVREAFQRDYLEMLQSPGVKNHVRVILSKGDAKEVKDLLSVLLPSLLPVEKGAAGRPPKLTIINKLGGGRKALDVTPKAAP